MSASARNSNTAGSGDQRTSVGVRSGSVRIGICRVN